mmetsp:Transcript_16479/g.24655  ORF Transcript_16479/g.24655 Transcript_16479/m.24655 type:complete len:97 (+) Transcript_16479:1025-1315(+)
MSNKMNNRGPSNFQQPTPSTRNSQRKTISNSKINYGATPCRRRGAFKAKQNSIHILYYVLGRRRETSKVLRGSKLGQGPNRSTSNDKRRLASPPWF